MKYSEKVVKINRFSFFSQSFNEDLVPGQELQTKLGAAGEHDDRVEEDQKMVIIVKLRMGT